MDKKQSKTNKIRRVPNWKFWTLILSIALILIILLSSLCYYGFNVWLNTMLLPAALGGIASTIVTICFTIKIDRERLSEELSREIDSVHEKVMKLLEEMHTISYFPFYSASLKKVMLKRTFMTKPEMYAIMAWYPELWKLYKKNTDYIIKEVGELSEANFDKQFKEKSVNWVFILMEIADCALRTQEQYRQDFKSKTKGPIKE